MILIYVVHTNKKSAGGIRLRNITRVFWFAVIICIAVVLWGSFIPDNLNDTTPSITAVVAVEFAWYYLVVIVAMISLCLFLMFSRFGEIKLGNDDDESEFRLPVWFAMLFSAGVGFGHMVFPTADTIYHARGNAP